MLTTPFGAIRLFLDSKEVCYTFEPVHNKVFSDVDGAYILDFDVSSDAALHELCCILENVCVNGGIESGEQLEAISFYIGQGKITIGCEGNFGCPEMYNYDYDGAYLPAGLKILINKHTKTRHFRFGVAWLTNCTAENNVQTWFAADPTWTASCK